MFYSFLEGLSFLYSFLSRRLSKTSEVGQGLLEYGLVLVLVAVAVVAILALLGPQIGEVFSTITTCVPPTIECPYFSG